MSDAATMTKAEFDKACATACVHCAAGHVATYRRETAEWVHTYSATTGDIDTPALAKHGGPKRLGRGTYAQTFCNATKLRNARQ